MSAYMHHTQPHLCAAAWCGNPAPDNHAVPEYLQALYVPAHMQGCRHPPGLGGNLISNSWVMHATGHDNPAQAE